MMRALLRCAVGLLTVSASDDHADVEALQLLQTSFTKVAVHSERECRAAKKAARDKKKKLKEDRVAAKVARNAAKAAIALVKESQTADAEAKADVESKCPAPEIDMSPDQGCSGTLVSSYIVIPSRRSREIDYVKTLPPDWYGLQKAVPGGGLPAGAGTVMGSKLGISLMQPCSVAWTVGEVSFVNQYYNMGTGQYRIDNVVYDVMKKKTVASPCECREWADKVGTFPDTVAVQFKTGKYGTPGECQVWSRAGDVPWEKGGFWLQLDAEQGMLLSCYLGNPEEWKQRLKAEQAAGQTMDKCRKTSLWAFGELYWQYDDAGRQIRQILAGTLNEPDPLSGTEGGRKMCLKWVKNDVRCAGAVAIQLKYDGQCYCSMSTNGVKPRIRREVPRPLSFSDGSRNGLSWETCLL